MWTMPQVLVAIGLYVDWDFFYMAHQISECFSTAFRDFYVIWMITFKTSLKLQMICIVVNTVRWEENGSVYVCKQPELNPFCLSTDYIYSRSSWRAKSTQIARRYPPGLCVWKWRPLAKKPAFAICWQRKDNEMAGPVYFIECLVL